MAKWNSHFLIVVMASVNTYALTGRVLDKVDMKPVSGAQITVAGSASSVETDSEGKFNLNPLPVIPHSENECFCPLFSQNTLLLPAPNKTPVKVGLFDIRGISHLSLTIRPGFQYTLADPIYLEQGLYTLTWSMGVESGSLHMMYMNSNGPLKLADKNSYQQKSLTPLAKKAAGTITISKNKLVEQVVPYVTDTDNLGDIILEYPPRKLGVGAEPIYGSVILFDGVGSRQKAQTTLDTGWGPWVEIDGLIGDKTGTQFKVVPDPEFKGDANHWTLQSCCEESWGYDDIISNQVHGDVQMHVEFILLGEYDNDDDPDPNVNDSRATGKPGYNNSGLYLQSRYELQILSLSDSKPLSDNHNMASLVNNESAFVDADKPNGVWQAYDITLRTSRWTDATTQSEPVYISAWWNGELIHNSFPLFESTGKSNHSGKPINTELFGLKLQSEGTDVRFRNIWMKHLKIEGTDTNFGY